MITPLYAICFYWVTGLAAIDRPEVQANIACVEYLPTGPTIQFYGFFRNFLSVVRY